MLAAADLDGPEREALLARECGGDAELLRDVLAYLGAPAVSTRVLFDPAKAAGQLPEAGAAAAVVPAAVAPPPEFGPFEVRRELGRGGMGVVYEARDKRSGRTVALKVVYPHLLQTEGLAERFAREAQAGLRIVHPNVVRTLELVRVGEGEGAAPILVMEYVEGRTLRDLLRSLGPFPEALLRELGRQIAEGLAAIHAAGVVHRDLKPENVLVTDDHRVRIMDLGVARLSHASAVLTKEGEFLGSLSYAAPEQCRGEEVGPAADLYSLGVLLQELARGENWFSRSNPAGAVAAHLHETPPPLDRELPRCSAFLAAVLGKLLAKRPEDRFASAAELAAVFAAGEEGTWWRERVRLLDAGTPRLPVSRDLPLRGRDGVLDLLRRAWREARDGHGSVVYVEGEAGLGKTRILDAFLSELPEGEAHILAGGFSPVGGICGVAESLVQKFGGNPEGEIARLIGVGAEASNAFAALIRGEPTDARGEAFVHFCGRLLSALAAEKPVVWVLDDVHHASAAGRTALVTLARFATTSRALVLTTSRPVGPDGVASALAAAGNFRRVELPRLTGEEVRDLLRERFQSEEIARELAGPITARSEGVPFFVGLLLASVLDDGIVREAAGGGYELARPASDLGVPGPAKEVLAGRLTGLSEEVREILSAAAIAGLEFDAGPVAAAVGRPLVTVLRRLAEVERTGGLVRSAGRGFRFEHALLADYLYESVHPLLREEYHGLIADALRASGPEPAGGRIYHVVNHYLSSSRPGEAAPFLAGALDHLHSRNLLEEYIDVAERALAAPGLVTGRERVELLLRLLKVLHATGRGARFQEAAEEARALARQLGDPGLRAEVHGNLGIAAANAGRSREAVARYRAAYRMGTAIGSPRFQMMALGNIGSVLMREGRTAEATEHMKECLRLARETKDDASALLAQLNLGAVDLRLGDFASARAAYEDALRLARRLGRRGHEAFAESSLGLLYWHSGDYPAASESLRRALDLAEESGDRRAEVAALEHMTILAVGCARYAEALRLIDRVLKHRREVGDLLGEGRCRALRAQVLMKLGDHDAARQDLEACVRAAEEGGVALSAADAWFGFAELAREEGDAAAEAGYAHRLIDLVEPAAVRSVLATGEFMLGRVAAEAGDETTASTHFQRAADHARATSASGVAMVVAAWRATLSGGDVAEAARVVDELESRAPYSHRLEARFVLWRLTGDLRHLARAHRLLREAVDLAPPSRRAAMEDGVRLHREIRAAWLNR